MKIESNKLKFIIYHLSFIIIFAVYLYTLCPTVSVGDSGEFITAASTLSLAHPPAYPLYSLLGKIFITLIPFGNPAYRMNLMSAFFALLTLFLLSKLLATRYSLLATFILAFTPVFWLQSLVTEVFTLNTFFAVLLIYLLIIHNSSFIIQKLYLFAFLFGLGLGNHHTLVLLLPGFAYLIFKEYQGIAGKKREKQKEKKILLLTRAIPLPLLCFLFFLLGFSVYLYLPIRSMNNPPLDWGNPETLKAFWRVVTRADYGSLRLMLETGERNLTFIEQIYRFFLGLKKNYTLFGLILSFLSLLFLVYKSKERFIFLSLLFFFSGPFFILLAKLPDSAEAWGVIERFYILPLIILTISLSYGVTYLMQKFVRYRVIFLFLFLCLPIYILMNNFSSINRRNFYLAYDYGRNNFRTLAPNSYFIMDGGDDTFYTTAYLKYVEKRRIDICPFDRGGLIFAHPYGKDFRQLTKGEKNIRREEVEKSLVKLNQPVFYSTMNEKILPGYQLNLAGILYQVNQPLVAAGSIPQFWKFYNLRSFPIENLSEYRVRALAPIYAYLRGVEKQKNEDLFAALKEWNYAYSLGADVKWLKSNLLYLLTELGIKYYYEKNYTFGEECFYQAIKIDPLYSLGYTNLGVIQEAKGENTKAKESYLQAIKSDPNAVDAYYNLAVVYWKEENWQKVVELLQKVVEINPQHQQALKYLAQARLHIK